MRSTPQATQAIPETLQSVQSRHLVAHQFPTAAPRTEVREGPVSWARTVAPEVMPDRAGRAGRADRVATLLWAEGSPGTAEPVDWEARTRSQVTERMVGRVVVVAMPI